jgi:hypothetical protein
MYLLQLRSEKEEERGEGKKFFSITGPQVELRPLFTCLPEV